MANNNNNNNNSAVFVEVVDLTGEGGGTGTPHPSYAGAGAASDGAGAGAGAGGGTALISTDAAKRDFFLTTNDLAQLQDKGKCVQFGGGIGCGAPTKKYYQRDLEKAAERAHGKEGYKRKREQREKRLANQKRKRDDENARANAALAEQNLNVPAGAGASNANAAHAGPDVKALRAGLLKQVKKGMGFRDSGAPAPIKVELPGISTASFAALIGRPQDPTLKTLARGHGGVYKHDVRGNAALCALFGCVETKLGKHFAGEGVSQRLCDSVVLKYKHKDETLVVHAGGEITLEMF